MKYPCMHVLVIAITTLEEGVLCLLHASQSYILHFLWSLLWYTVMDVVELLHIIGKIPQSASKVEQE